MINLKTDEIPLERLFLDPNNYRFASPGEDQPVAEGRIAEEAVQNEALEKLKKDGIKGLLHSILKNGFLSVDRIVVRPLKASTRPEIVSEGDEDDNLGYVVIEGNRRVAALKSIQRDAIRGIEISQELRSVFQAVPVLVATEGEGDDFLAIMGVRHVGGPKQWGGYQSAQLINSLFVDSELNAKEIAYRLGLSTQEVNRRNRAFMALRNFSEDEEYGDSTGSEHYPIFHEVVGAPKLREWLEWDAKEFSFDNEANRTRLYAWIAGEDDRKIYSHKDIRSLIRIISNGDALDVMDDPEKSLADALAIAQMKDSSEKLEAEIDALTAQLGEAGFNQVESKAGVLLEKLPKLKEAADKILKYLSTEQP